MRVNFPIKSHTSVLSTKNFKNYGILQHCLFLARGLPHRYILPVHLKEFGHLCSKVTFDRAGFTVLRFVTLVVCKCNPHVTSVHVVFLQRLWFDICVGRMFECDKHVFQPATIDTLADVHFKGFALICNSEHKGMES